MFLLVNAAGKYSYKSFKDGLAPVKSQVGDMFFSFIQKIPWEYFPIAATSPGRPPPVAPGL